MRTRLSKTRNDVHGLFNTIVSWCTVTNLKNKNPRVTTDSFYPAVISDGSTWLFTGFWWATAILLQIGHSGQQVHPSPATTEHTQVSLTFNTDASLFIFSTFFLFFSDVTAPSCSTLVASRATIDGRAIKHREERVNRRTISNLYCYPCAGPQFKPIVNPTSLFMMFMTVHGIVTRGNREKNLS